MMDPLMAFWIFLIGIIAGLIFGVTLVYRTAVSPLHKKIEKLSSKKILEQFESYIEEYPYPLENFRFIGAPIDGIQFEDDCIIFVKFKTDKSRLTPIQNKIKKLVKDGKTRWFEFRMQ